MIITYYIILYTYYYYYVVDRIDVFFPLNPRDLCIIRKSSFAVWNSAELHLEKVSEPTKEVGVRGRKEDGKKRVESNFERQRANS